mmetsp:Transcript_28915/g.47351  ORF Transcript_28915/g.47351 Transcript_28915/m.47351 type:complete len:266 (+) Transcript_28915:32-829(+)
MGNEVSTVHSKDAQQKSDGEETPLTPVVTFQRKFARNGSAGFPDIDKLALSPANISLKAGDFEKHKIPNQLSDCWSIEDPKLDAMIAFSETVPNSVFLRPGIAEYKTWITVFGTKIASKTEYKRWHIRILPNPQRIGGIKGNDLCKTAHIMLGIVDINNLSYKQRGCATQIQFWERPFFGYAFGAATGRKYHCDAKGVNYGSKCKIGDTIAVVLNRTCNNITEHSELEFHTNDIVHGKAFNVDDTRNYILAVALSDDTYQIQIEC